MGLMSWLTGSSSSGIEDLTTAEEYLSAKCSDEHITALVRHYQIEEVTDDIQRFAGASLRDSETAQVVQKLRDKYGMGLIADYNMPGYIDPDDYPEDQADRREQIAQREQEQSGGGFIGWLLGR